MKKIELTELELKVLKESVEKTFEPMNATQEECFALNKVIHQAEDLMEELDAYDELENDLMLWYYEKYTKQESTEIAPSEHEESHLQ